MSFSSDLSIYHRESYYSWKEVGIIIIEIEEIIKDTRAGNILMFLVYCKF